MNCNQFHERLADHLGGELPPAERPAFEAHLAQCADCRAAASELEAAQRQLRALDLSQAAAQTHAWRIGLPSQPARQTPGWTRMALTGLRYAALVLVAFGLGYWAGAVREPAQPDGDARNAIAAPAAARAAAPSLLSNYQRAAIEFPGTSSLGLALLSVARD